MIWASLVEKLIFPVPKASYTANSFPSELIWIPMGDSKRSDDESIPAVLLQCKDARFFFVFFHANAEDLGITYRSMHHLRKMTESNVLSVEFPGYGICPGKPSEEGCTKVAKAAMRFVINTLKWPAEDVIPIGRSLGTYSALQAAVYVSTPLAGVVLINPFASIRSTAKVHIGLLSAMVPDCFDNLELAARLKSKLVVIHGKKDTLVPVSEGRKLFSHVSYRHKKLYTPSTMKHNSDLFDRPEWLQFPIFDSFPLPDYRFKRRLKVPPSVYRSGIQMQARSNRLRHSSAPARPSFPTPPQSREKSEERTRYQSPPKAKIVLRLPKVGYRQPSGDEGAEDSETTGDVDTDGSRSEFTVLDRESVARKSPESSKHISKSNSGTSVDTFADRT